MAEINVFITKRQRKQASALIRAECFLLLHPRIKSKAANLFPYALTPHFFWRYTRYAVLLCSSDKQNFAHYTYILLYYKYTNLRDAHYVHENEQMRPYLSIFLHPLALSLLSKSIFASARLYTFSRRWQQHRHEFQLNAKRHFEHFARILIIFRRFIFVYKMINEPSFPLSAPARPHHTRTNNQEKKFAF